MSTIMLTRFLKAKESNLKELDLEVMYDTLTANTTCISFSVIYISLGEIFLLKFYLNYEIFV